MKPHPYKQGGMATIWLGKEKGTNRTCIIKTPRRGTNIDNVYLDKLMQEAGYLNQLSHPNIVKYLDDFYLNGEFHLVVEHISGENMMPASPRSSQGEQKIVDWACQLLDALAYIHSSGIIHRDINPKNIMLSNDGLVKLIDFGTAKGLNGSIKETGTKDPFTQIANKGFDIPELFMGGESDQRCDLCGLAQTCIYLLPSTQRPLCQPDKHELAHLQRGGRRSQLPYLKRGLETDLQVPGPGRDVLTGKQVRQRTRYAGSALTGQHCCRPGSGGFQMRLSTLFTVLLCLAAVTAVIACLPVLAGAVGAPADNYTIPEIPTDNTTPDEIKPAVNFLPEGPSSQAKSAAPGVIAVLTAVPERYNSLITAGDTWFLDIDVNSPGWLYIYEYYPKGSDPGGKWIAYKWRLKESGVWKLGPFSAADAEPEGEHIYRIWFYSGGKWVSEDPQSQINNVISWTYSLNSPPLKIISFEINPPAVNAEEGTLLFWEVQGASSVEISGIGTMAGPGGTLMIKPAATTTYVLTASDPGGRTMSKSATVTVRPLPFAEQAMKFLGNPVILIMAGATFAIIALGFVLLRRRRAAQSEAKETLSLPTLQPLEKPGGLPPVSAKLPELPGGLEIRIAHDTRTVGRADVARGLEIDKLGLISRQHFRITIREDQFYIEDLGTAGGTRLNGTDIRERGEISLKDDDLIEPAGVIKLRFRVL
jgi:serine/threonine protein kinase